MLSYCFIHIWTFSLLLFNIDFMVLKCIRLSSGDQIPVHKNNCLSVLNIVRFLILYLETDNENV